MKLRILANSLRIRLTQNETRLLADGQALHERFVFGVSANASFAYSIVPCSRSTKICVEESPSQGLCLKLPFAAVRTWASGADVGCYESISIASGLSLDVAIEKDFRCLKPRPGKDDEDTFPNPDMACGACC